MLAKGETQSASTSALNAPVRSRSSIIAAQLGGKSKIRAIEPAAELPFRPVAPESAKPRMSLAEFQAAQIQSTLSVATAAISESPVAELDGMSEADLLRKLAELDKCKLEAKLLYARCDMLEAEILEATKPGDIIKMADGRNAVIVDNFSGIDKNTGKLKNISWRPCGVRRFEIEFTKAGK